MRQSQWENIHTALALVLGPKTDDELRARAARRLARQDVQFLPLLVSTLNSYPEITTPAWPWHPPQYQHCSRLLLHFCRKMHITLPELLQPPYTTLPPGPVLWTSILEATVHVQEEDFETLLCQGLATPWASVRYSAALALATLASRKPLQSATCELLQQHLREHEAFPVRLTAACALLQCGKSSALNTILALIEPTIPLDVRRAALFVLAIDLPVHCFAEEQERLVNVLLRTLEDEHADIVQAAVHTLGKLGQVSVLPFLRSILMQSNSDSSSSLAALMVLEELAVHKDVRTQMRRQGLPACILPLCSSSEPELRRQACYTLAACGGEYAAAALGTLALNAHHPGHGEAVESLRQLHGLLRAPLRENALHWLLRLLPGSPEEIQVTALDSLSHFLWRASMHGQKHIWSTLSKKVLETPVFFQLLQKGSPSIRQHTLELLTHCDTHVSHWAEFVPILERHLLLDKDDGVRACAAYVCGQLKARWALPGLLLALLDTDEDVARTALNSLDQIASPDDFIVQHVLLELITSAPKAVLKDDILIQDAHRVLKKWQKVEKDSRGDMQRALHSSC